MAASESVTGWMHLLQRRIEGFGRFTSFALRSFGLMIVQPSSWLRWRLLGPQLYAVGVASIPVVAITGVFIGMILSLEGYFQFASIGQENRMGGIINASVTRQIGPVLAAVMVAGRVGGALAAEIGSMRVTDQLDAMRAMAADPIRILVVPRVVACMVMTPLLTLYSDLLGSAGAWFVTVKIYDVSSVDYWHFTANYVRWWDPANGLVKSVFFGASIGLIACWKGFTCAPGASGVGRASTAAFVNSFLAIIALNLVLAEFLNTLQFQLDPQGPAQLLS
ncbi:MAG: ABC transporter permease [Phycisphaerae bacterium]|nr:ABC transporter permease [Phycisphaerae bacterium]